MRPRYLFERGLRISRIWLRSLVLLEVVLLLGRVAVAQQPDPSRAAPVGIGMPLLENYAPQDYSAVTRGATVGHSQNWSVTQGLNGLLFVGNNEGVLIHDGVRWRGVPVGIARHDAGRGRRVTSLARGDGDTIFVAGQRTFGYLAADSIGRPTYRSLLETLPENERAIDATWKVSVTSDGAYFLTDDRLFRWAGGRMRTWTTDALPSFAGAQPSEEQRYFFFCFAVRDTLFVQVRGAGLYRVVEDRLTPVPGGGRFGDDGIYVMLPYGPSEVLVGTRTSGLFLFDGARFRRFPTDADAFLQENQLYHGAVLPDGGVALATRRGGVAIIERHGTLRHVLDTSSGLRDDMVRYVFVDRDGAMWLALNDGLSRVDVSAPYRRYGRRMGVAGTVKDVVRAAGHRYVCTSTGLYLQRLGAPHGHAPFVRRDGVDGSCVDLLPTEDGVLIATTLGVSVVRGDRLEPVVRGADVRAAVLNHAHDTHRRVLVGLATGGLVVLQHTGSRWRRERRVDDVDIPVRVLVDGPDGAYWGGDLRTALVRIQLDAAGATLTRYGEDEGLPVLTDNRLFVLGGRLLVGTRAGLRRYDSETDRFVPDSTFGADLSGSPWIVSHVVRGRADTVWVRAAHRHHPAGRKMIRPYVRGADGRYTPGAPLHRLLQTVVRTVVPRADGRVWLGADGHRGPLLLYDPHRVRPRPPLPPVHVHHLRMRPADSLVYAGFGTRAPLVFPHTQNGVRVTYGVPQFQEAAATQYRIRLDGLDAGWSPWSTETRADFTNLAPGRYTVFVEARDLFERSSAAPPLAFSIEPPWYRTRWAELLWGLLALAGLGGGGYGVVQWRTRRLRRRQRVLERVVDERTRALRAEKIKTERQAEALTELDEVKSRFFANLSHEFRTPLTLILGPLEDQLGGSALPESLHDQHRMMLRNGKRLLHLINQILDLSRLEAGRMTLDPRPLDVVGFARRLTAAFQPLAERQHLDLSFEAPAAGFVALADEEQLEKVVTNLLSNAIKFTPAGGGLAVSVASEPAGVTIRVSDTGVGIPEDELPHLFDRFHQVDGSATRAQEGTGIGLALAKELTELHGGTLSVDSVVGEGSTFVVRLPRSDVEINDTEPDRGTETATPLFAPQLAGLAARADAAEAEHAESVEEDRPAVLVVDDNEDVRTYVRSILERSYGVFEAADGDAGLAAAREHLPDLVVADVMMPGRDGLAMNRALNEDAATAGIPVILLTARAEAADQVEGLESGADAYLTKPFDAGVLLARIDGLLNQRRRLRERLRAEWAEKGLPQDPEEAGRTPFEREVRQVIRTHLADRGFSVTDLADSVALSRSQLYRRLKQDADVSPSALVRQVRLEEARRLLFREAGRVSEVAYAVGFNSLSHFTQCFREHFGETPSDVLEHARERDVS